MPTAQIYGQTPQVPATEPYNKALEAMRITAALREEEERRRYGPRTPWLQAPQDVAPPAVTMQPTAQQWLDLKARVDDFDLGSPFEKKLDELDQRMRTMAAKMTEIKIGGDGGGQHFSLEKLEAIKQLPIFDNLGKVSFEKWTSVIKSQVAKKEEWKGILSWAQSQGHSSIDDHSLEPEYEGLGKELWALFDYKLEAEPWKFRRTVSEGNGLELWRKLHEEYDPRDPSEATVLKIQLNNLSKIKDASEVRSRIEALEFAVSRYDAMAEIPMSQSEKHSMLSRITPIEFMKSQLLAGNDVSQYRSLKDRLLLWAKGDKEHRKLTSSSSAPMDVSAVGGESNRGEDMVAKILQGMQDMQSQTTALVAAMVKGNKGARQRSDDQSKGSGGKGAPMSGKGPSGPMVTLPNGNQIQASRLRICRDYARDGQCPKGKACVFPHVSGLPKTLQEKACSSRGLMLASLGSMGIKDGAHQFDSSKEGEVLASLNATRPKPEVGGLDAAMEEWRIEGIDEATLESMASGFGGPDH